VSAWRAHAIVRESVRNLLPPRGALGAGLLLSIAVGIALGGVLASRASELLERARADESTWQPVVMISAVDPISSDEVHIARSSCDGLQDDPRVLRSGLVVTEPPDEIVQLGPATRVVAVSGSIVAWGGSATLVGAELDPPGGSEVIRGRRLGRLHAEPLALQPDRLGLNSAVVVPLDVAISDGPVCAVVLRPFVPPADTGASLQARLSVVGPPVAARADAASDVRSAYLGRVERFLPSLVGIVLGILSLGVAASRRSHLASYLLCGSARGDVVAILLVEQALVSGATALAVVLGVVVGAAPPGMAASVMLGGLVAPTLSFAVVMPGAVLILRPNPLTFAKES